MIETELAVANAELAGEKGADTSPRQSPHGRDSSKCHNAEGDRLVWDVALMVPRPQRANGRGRITLGRNLSAR